ncbi:hypothetical protein [Wolbachia endosymbiont (group A) of Scambus nigricans]|uniref:hypothetical protein n=1 Tax=Wolbachia endosymbiont (group A) of Scambus nigricans TaxID=2954055 RepID=UPI00222F9EBB|nr:hypothetical protein [Wolbachia endosymbiont (group A) of Scambus nigricans]
MLLACYSHKHISYRIRTIIRKAINYILTCTEDGRYLAAEAGTNNNLSSNSNVVLITHVAANRSAQLD